MEAERERVAESLAVPVLHENLYRGRRPRPRARNFHGVLPGHLKGVGHPDHRVGSRIHVLNPNALELQGHLVGSVQALGIPGARHHELVPNLERQRDLLAAHVPRHPAIHGKSDALPVELCRETVPLVDLRRPHLERVVPRPRLEAVHVAVHCGHEEVHETVVVQVIEEHHAVRGLADVHDVRAARGPVHEVEEAVKGHGHKVKPGLGRVVELGQQDGAHDHRVGLVGQYDPPRRPVKREDRS
mmetsp:Transcript_2227/g.7436  ORF Transcript_2227/g.7436 Transcript_2227/m.7436 type:complete len:243 (-) Transcript_2227:1674-2402(-)